MHQVMRMALFIKFQNGPIGKVGTNGVADEDLLAILIDRMRCFVNGPLNCPQNNVALSHLEEAAMALGDRTRDREARGVEGTHAA